MKLTFTMTLVMNCGKTSKRKVCSGSPAASLHRKRYSVRPPISLFAKYRYIFLVSRWSLFTQRRSVYVQGYDKNYPDEHARHNYPHFLEYTRNSFQSNPCQSTYLRLALSRTNAQKVNVALKHHNFLKKAQMKQWSDTGLTNLSDPKLHYCFLLQHYQQL